MTPSAPLIPANPSPDDDRGFEVAIGRVLGIGVAASSACLAVGLVMTLASGGGTPARALLAMGLVLLMATPVARVALSALRYARRRDWIFAALTVIVLLELVASIIVAFQSAR